MLVFMWILQKNLSQFQREQFCSPSMFWSSNGNQYLW